MTSHPNTRNNFEDNAALRRKLELLYSQEVDVRDELKFAASLFLKKPRKDIPKEAEKGSCEMVGGCGKA